MSESVTEHSYCKVFGKARKDAALGIYISALYVEPIANLNDITIHLIECVKHAKDLKRAKLNAQLNRSAGNLSGLPTIAGLNQLEQLILNLIRVDTSDLGVSVNQICESLRSIDQNRIKQTIIALSNDGMIFETNDNCWKYGE